MKTIPTVLIIPIFCFFMGCSNGYKIKTTDLTLALSDDGKITSLIIGNDQIEKPTDIYTSIEGCRQDGKTTIQQTNDGAVTFERKLINDSLQTSCIVVEIFTPTPHSIRWTVEVKGIGEPWGSGIRTHIHYPAQKDKTLFWTTWGAPQFDPATVTPSMQQRLKAYRGGGTAQQSFLNVPSSRRI